MQCQSKEIRTPVGNVAGMYLFLLFGSICILLFCIGRVSISPGILFSAYVWLIPTKLCHMPFSCRELLVVSKRLFPFLAGWECLVLYWVVVEIGSRALCRSSTVRIQWVVCPASLGVGNFSHSVSVGFWKRQGK